MFDPSVSTDKYLYHYTKLETALEHIFPNRQLRLGLFSLTNDPRESKTWFFSLTNPPLDDINELLSINLAFSQGLRMGCKLLCLSMDEPEKPETIYEGRGYHRPRMWAQYADNHRGVCFVFNKELLIRTAQQELFGKGTLYAGAVTYDKHIGFDSEAFSVRYQQYLSLGVTNLVQKMIDRHYRTYYMKKHIDWQQEHEYRFVLRGSGETPEFISIQDSIEAVILGPDFPESYKPLIRQFCDTLNIYHGEMRWRNGSPDIVKYKRAPS